MRELRTRPDRQASPRGGDRTLQILNAAKAILIRDGYRGLTLRAIAHECGISVGNLNYYYARKGDLLRDLVDRVYEAYLAEFGRIREQAVGSPRDELEAVLRFLFHDLGTRETTVFFPEIWALANHEPYAAEAMDRLYAAERRSFEELIHRVNPRLGPKTVRMLALHASASIEGHTMFVGDGKPFAGQRKELADLLVERFLETLDTLPVEEP